ncbi:MAG TPA: hypothetical protein VF525_12670 [Pyrinomonadaceae bacterium]|jgi:hypothetical protein
MKRWLLVFGLAALVVCSGLWLAFGPALKGRAVAPPRPPVAAQRGEPLTVQVAPWGPTEEQIETISQRLARRGPLLKLLRTARSRMLSFELLNPDDKSSATPTPPERYRATFYDYTNNRTVYVEGSFNDPATLNVSVSDYQPLPSNEEFKDAVKILKTDARFSAALATGRLRPYQTMPPLIYTERGADGRVERTMTVGVMAQDPVDPNVERTNEVLGVNLARRHVIRYDAGAPPTSAAIPEATCGPASANQTTTSRGAAGQYQFTIMQGSTELWSFLAIRPAASSGQNASGIELLNVKYLGRMVLKRAHVPVFNVKYDADACGPYRDWAYQENMFQATGTDVPGTNGGVRDCGTNVATTILETGNDTGNYRGVAFYKQGDEVVLVSELTAGWYRYISEWGFHADGTISPRFGYGATSNSCVCAGHHHHAYWRFDFDIDGADNRVFEQRGALNTFPLTTETKRARNAQGMITWLVQNPATGAAYMIRPNENDGLAARDATGYASGDLWLLRYRNTELDDSATATSTKAGLDAFIGNEPLDDKDVVIWYGAHFDHLDAANAVNERHMTPLTISGEHVHGPDLVPVRW